MSVFFVAVSFAVAFSFSFFFLTQTIEYQVWYPHVDWPQQPALDIWFESDPPLVHKTMTDTETGLQKTNRHPFWPVIGLVPVKVIGFLGVPERLSVCLVLASGVGLASALFSLTLLFLQGCGIFSWLVQSLFLASATFIFWAGIVDRFPIGAATILATTASAAYFSREKRMSIWLAVALNVVSLSATITNGMFGLLLNVCFFKFKTAARITVYALVLTCVLWFAQGLFIKHHVALIEVEAYNQTWLLNPYAGSFLQKLVVLLGASVVIPVIHPYNYSDLDTVGIETSRLLGVQHSVPGADGPLEFILALGWAFLLIVSAILWLRRVDKTPFDTFLFLGIGGQLVLHLIYGTELFLYSFHLAPLLFLTVARGIGDLNGKALQGALFGLCLFIPLLAIHNFSEYEGAWIRYLESYEVMKGEVRRDSSSVIWASPPVGNGMSID